MRSRLEPSLTAEGDVSDCLPVTLGQDDNGVSQVTLTVTPDPGQQAAVYLFEAVPAP
jgi:hypothetical protein